MPKAIVIIPTYNEKENITPTITALQKIFKKIKNWQLGILVVDDNSPDKTAQIVKKLQKKQPNLHLLVKPKKAGLGDAYLKGMEHAFNKLQANVVFEFDADLSHDPSKIPQFLNKIDQGYDFVIGSRYIKGGGIPQNWGLHRKFLSVVGNLVILLVLANWTVRDWTSGYRAITKKAYQAVVPELVSSRFSGYTFQIGFLHKTIKKGFKVTEVPFVFKDRELGKSKIGPEYIKNTLVYIFKMRLQEILKSRVFKFIIVGTIGASVQLSTLQFWRLWLPYQLAFFLAIEGAVLTNFILSNFWTFADRKLKLNQYPVKFVQFNLASGGSILIQQLIAFIGELFVGLFPLFTIPIVNFVFDTGTLYAVIGILVGMFWNFFAYSRIIWKHKAS
ncbi:MAG: glycosyltransferase [Candidatus Pacebacteria bacterium]|nr:glycosyltransferase [Candidatus Paceibacterota bacterium]